MKKFVLIVFIVSLVSYFITSNYVYKLEYINSEMETKIQKQEKYINELMIKQNTNSSKEEATQKTSLKFQDNVYYLKKEVGSDAE